LDGVPSRNLARVSAPPRSRRLRRAAGAGGVAVALALTAVASAADGRGSDVGRGRYLATEVAMCVQCHTPRTERGELDATRLFAGAVIPVASPFANQLWAARAPALAGLPGWTDADAITLLTTGRRPSGAAPSPPMPAFHLTSEDAAAVVAYLRSLGGR